MYFMYDFIIIITIIYSLLESDAVFCRTPANLAVPAFAVGAKYHLPNLNTHLAAKIYLW